MTTSAALTVNLIEPFVELTVTSGPHRGKVFRLVGHDNFLVGRSPLVHFRLPKRDLYFSRLHFMIEANPPECALVDLGSTNGTFINGRRTKKGSLQHGDTIQGGFTRLLASFSWGGEEDLVEPLHEGDAGIALSEAATVFPSDPSGPGILDLDNVFPHIPYYKLVRELGRGAVGSTYLGIRQSDNAAVAIKTIRPAAPPPPGEVALFLREASKLKTLRHPGISACLEVSEHNGILYFVMEYVNGMSVASILHGGRSFSIGRAVRLACDALFALGHAHKNGAVHRDIKPTNLLIHSDRNEERCIISDFGIAKTFHASTLSGLTLSKSNFGIFDYMSPEQITDFRRLRPESDQYSLAAVLYHMLAGTSLFGMEETIDPNAMIVDILEKEPEHLANLRSDIPPLLASAVHRALSKDPRHRFPSVLHFQQSIAPFKHYS